MNYRKYFGKEEAKEKMLLLKNFKLLEHSQERIFGRRTDIALLSNFNPESWFRDELEVYLFADDTDLVRKFAVENSFEIVDTLPNNLSLLVGTFKGNDVSFNQI